MWSDHLGAIDGIAGDANGRVVAVTHKGSVLLSDDGGIAWRMAAHRIPVPGVSYSAAIIFQDNGVVVAMSERAFMRSTDGGETWRPVDSDLPDRTFVLGPHCIDGKGLIVIAGSGGMLTRSTDWGATWQRGQMSKARKAP